MNKKIIGIVVAGAILLATGVYVWYDISSMVQKVEEERVLTEALTAEMRELLEKSPEYYAYQPGDIPKWKQFLVTKIGHYDLPLNELLDTRQYLPGENVEGLVVISIQTKEVGEYYRGDKRTYETAQQPYYVLHYLDVSDKVVLYRDTIWGEEPPERKTATESWVGDYPGDKEVAGRIRETLDWIQ